MGKIVKKLLTRLYVYISLDCVNVRYYSCKRFYALLYLEVTEHEKCPFGI